jgi:uncharacterized protein
LRQQVPLLRRVRPDPRDRLQKMSTGHVSPDSFTHGSSAQRMQWFQKGFDSGTIAACNTFDSAQ